MKQMRCDTIIYYMNKLTRHSAAINIPEHFNMGHTQQHFLIACLTSMNTNHLSSLMHARGENYPSIVAYNQCLKIL